MRYAAYCRKSQESEDRQILSLESQRQELTERFEENPDIDMTHTFTESMSAKAPGRPQFNDMIALIQSGKCDGIVAWHPDRLARNSVDAGLIIYLLDTGAIKDLKFVSYTFENTPEGKLMLSTILSHSKYFVDGLSKNVKRGNRTKLKAGWRPNKAPIGYLNCKETKTIIPDPDRFEIIQEIFTLMASGCYTPRMLYEKAKNEFGLRSLIRKRSGGKPISLSSMYSLLSNPFYTGLILWKGELHQGKHKPAVSITDYDVIQTILQRKSLKPRSHKSGMQFAYTGMMNCGECNCAITAEKKVNRFNSHYVYYHCTHRKTGYLCKQGSLEVKQLESQFLEFLDEITIDQNMHDLLTEAALKEQRNCENINIAKLKSLKTTQNKNEIRLKNLVEMRMNNLITDDEFKEQRTSLQFEQMKITEKSENLNKVDEWFEPFKDYLECRRLAKKWFAQGNLEVKRMIMNSIGSNPMIMDKKLSIQAAKPFFQIAKSSNFSCVHGVVKEFRKQYGFCDVRVTLSTLKQLKKLINQENIK